MSDQRVNDRIYDTASGAAQPPSTLPNEPYYQQPSYQQPNVGNQKARRTLGIALVIIGLLWFAVGGLGSGPFGEGSDTLYDNTLAGSRLEMDVGSADVKIQPWNQDGIHITAIQRGGDEDTYSVDVSESGDIVRVTQTEKDSFSFFGDNGLHYVVQIPADVEASIQTNSGEIEIDGNSGGVTLTSASGDIEARNISNGITIETQSGEVNLRDSAGTLNVKTTSGDIELHEVADTLNLESVSGEITVRDAGESQLTASTTSGDVRYDGELVAGANTITTISGQVEVRIPDDSVLQIQTNTTSGEVDSDFPLNADDGETSLAIQTTSGDIEIRGR